VSITYLEAQDELYGMVNAAMAAAAPTVGLTYTPALYFPDTEVVPPNIDVLYAEASFVVVTAEQASLGSIRGVSMYEETGLLAVQVYSPKANPENLRIAQQIGEAIRTVFRGRSTSGAIWFRRQKLTPVAGNTTKNQVNVVATCIYKTYQ